MDHDRLGIYLGSGEGSLDFDNYAASNLGGWDAGKGEVDAVRWAKIAGSRMSMLREVEQESNMPLTHLAMEFEARGACVQLPNRLRREHPGDRRGDRDPASRRCGRDDLRRHTHDDSFIRGLGLQSPHGPEHAQ